MSGVIQTISLRRSRRSSERCDDPRLRGIVFIVQESIHGDSLSRHERCEDAVVLIEDMIREGLAEPGQFNIRELDEDGRIVRVFDPAAANSVSR